MCDVMGEIDMDGPRDEEGRILDPEFYPVRAVEHSEEQSLEQ